MSSPPEIEENFLFVPNDPQTLDVGMKTSKPPSEEDFTERKALPVLVKDAIYYMETAVFKIEDHLFRVPTHYFKTSTPFFAPFFGSPDAEKAALDEKIIELEDVTPSEFRALLKLLYPVQASFIRQTPLVPTMDEWISILKLSTQWTMLDVRRVAINTLTSTTMPPADRVVLARKYSVTAWLRSAYVELAKAAPALSKEDVEKIGLSTAFKIHRTREKFMSSAPVRSSQPIHPKPQSFVHQEICMKRRSIERVLLARTHAVANWLRIAFIELVQRDKPLSVEESKTIGYDTAIRLYAARERRFTAQPRASAATDTLIDEELKEELGALTNHGPVDRVVLANEYGVVEWLREAFVELMTRPESISIDEAQVLGYETAIRLSIVRDRHSVALRRNRGSGSVSTPNPGMLVDDELGTELSALSQCSAVDRVIIARKAGVEELAQDALVELVERKDMVSEDEAAALGLETAIWLCQSRLKYREGSDSYVSWSDAAPVNTEFQVELSGILEMDKLYSQSGDAFELEGGEPSGLKSDVPGGTPMIAIASPKGLKMGKGKKRPVIRSEATPLSFTC